MVLAAGKTRMLVDSSTGIDLNNAGADLQGVDVLMDVPQVISVVRVRYANGTRLEISYCGKNTEGEDVQTAREMMPTRAIALKGWYSDTLGCDHGDEYTTAYWVFE
ncbi:hypothetical protein ACFTZI_19270 [Streptomyces decoyicus]|uniref:hypothetical protein n=1 Tax=Streptomyces decoyicus TaxID=249567 RepID=UPI003643103A